MNKFGWIVFQMAVAGPVFYFVDQTGGKGLVPAILAMLAALLATVALSKIIDLWSTRRIRIREQPHSQGSRPPPIPGSDQGSEHVGRSRIGQDTSDL